MTISATLTDSAQAADFSVVGTVTFTDGLGYSAVETITVDPSMSTPALSALLKNACAKHAALAAKRTAMNTLTNNGVSKPFAASIGTVVATYP